MFGRQGSKQILTNGLPLKGHANISMVLRHTRPFFYQTKPLSPTRPSRNGSACTGHNFTVGINSHRYITQAKTTPSKDLYHHWKALLRFELRISCLQDRRFNQLCHSANHGQEGKAGLETDSNKWTSFKWRGNYIQDLRHTRQARYPTKPQRPTRPSRNGSAWPVDSFMERTNIHRYIIQAITTPSKDFYRFWKTQLRYSTHFASIVLQQSKSTGYSTLRNREHWSTCTSFKGWSWESNTFT